MPSIILIRIPLILLILSVEKYFELVSQVWAVLGKAIYAHYSFPANKQVLEKMFLAICLIFVKIVQLWHSERDLIKLVNCGKLEFISTVSFLSELSQKIN